jgi:hypothetical protein
MKKKIGIMLALVFVAGGTAFAVDWAAYPDSVTKGKFIFNAGIGLGTPLRGAMVVPPIILSADYALPLGGLPFTLGLLGGFTTSQEKWSAPYTGVDYGYTHSYTGIAIAGRFGYHPNLGVKNLDVYADIALGYYIFSGKAEYSGSWGTIQRTSPNDYSQFYWGLNLGARYFFANALGVFVELGYSVLSSLTVGISLKT